VCPSPETELDAASKTLAAFFDKLSRLAGVTLSAVEGESPLAKS
jgi:hypothetical protein